MMIIQTFLVRHMNLRISMPRSNRLINGSGYCLNLKYSPIPLLPNTWIWPSRIIICIRIGFVMWQGTIQVFYIISIIGCNTPFWRQSLRRAILTLNFGSLQRDLKAKSTKTNFGHSIIETFESYHTLRESYLLRIVCSSIYDLVKVVKIYLCNMTFESIQRW